MRTAAGQLLCWNHAPPHPLSVHSESPDNHGFRVIRTLAGIIVLVLASAVPAAAQKTDSVTLTNGNAITCELKMLQKGRLKADTDDMGTLNVEWDNVVSVTSPAIFQVETSDGLRLIGSLTSTSIGTVNIVTTNDTLTVRLIDVVFLAPIGKGFLARLEGSFNVGADYTQSTGVGQFSVTADTTYRRPNFEFNASASTYVTKQRDADDSERDNFQASYLRPFSHHWFMLGQGRVDRNPDLGYEVRSGVAGGVGRDLIRSNRAMVQVGAGLSTSYEVTEEDSTQTLDAFFGARQSFFTYDSPKTEVSLEFAAYPGLSQWGRIRLEFEGVVSREIISDFTMGISLYDSYDNQPPSADARRNDFGFSFTAGWKF
jgi:hypothetical protein